MTALSASRSSASDTHLPLAPGAPHLWLCRLDSVANECTWEQYRALLSRSELDLCARPRQPLQRRRAVLTRALVRIALSRYAPVRPEQWAFDRDTFDKPRIVDPADSRLKFNVSHCENWIACAISCDAAVGVDVQRCDAGHDLLRLADRFFTPEESRALHSLPQEARTGRFYDYWTLKEAWLKATGRGLSGGLDSIRFELEPRGRLTAHPGEPEFPAHFWTWHLEPDYRLALCVRCEHATPAPALPMVTARPPVDLEYSSPPPNYCGTATPRGDQPLG